MAHFQRLIGLLCLFFFCGESSAVIVPSQTITWNNSGMYLSSSPATSCNLFAAANGQVSGVLYGAPPTYRCQAGPFNVPIGQIVQSVCPANSVLTGSTCTCNASFLEFGGSCISSAENCKNVAAAMSLGGTYTSQGGGLSLCYGGCSVSANGSTTGTKSGVTSSTEYHGPFTSDGTTCTSDAASKTQTPCAVGSTPGTVNGLTVCSPDSSTNVVQAGPKTAASSPSSASSAPVVDSGAPTGATGSSSSTSCTGGNCTTTKTYTNSSGAVVGTVTKTETQSEFCALNPGVAMCQKSGSFSGSCDSAPACSGDAVQCAAAKAVFETQCLLDKTLKADDDSVSAANAAKSGEDKKDTDSLKANAPKIQVSSFNTSGRGWPRSCPSDPEINIPWGSGGSLTVPFHVICSPLELFALAAVGITMLGSLAYVLGGIRT